MNFYGGERRLSEDEEWRRRTPALNLLHCFFPPKMRQIFSEEPLAVSSGLDLQTDTQCGVLLLQPNKAFYIYVDCSTCGNNAATQVRQFVPHAHIPVCLSSQPAETTTALVFLASGCHVINPTLFI